MAEKTDKTAQQTFDFETVAIVVYVMGKAGITLGGKHYEMMSAADGKRGKASFDHQFRKVKARAKEIAESMGDEDATPVKKTPSKRSHEETNGDDDNVTKTPAKKSKKLIKKEEPGSGSEADAPGSVVGE